jgi:hypothetical protein
MLRRWPNTFYTDEFNPASLVSHANVDDTKVDLEAVDMIRDMKDKLTMLPELSPLFMKHEEKLGETLSKLVRLADGEGLKTHSGLHGLRGIDDDLMFSIIGATVQVPNRVYKVLSSLGPKLYFFRTKFVPPTKEQLKANLKGADFRLKVRNIKDALFSYLKWLEVCPLMENLVSIPNTEGGLDQNKIESSTRRVITQWDKSKDEDSALDMIAELALLLAKLRGNTYAYESKSTGAKLGAADDDGNNDGGSNDDIASSASYSYEYNFEQPIIENATRANQVLYHIAKAHAFELDGRNYVTMQDIPIVIKIALSSANHNRVSVLKAMITEVTRADNGGQLEHKKQFYVNDLVNSASISKATARRIMKELQVLEIVRIDKAVTTSRNYSYYIELLPDFNWLLEYRFQNLIKDFDWAPFATGEDEDEEESQPMHMHRIGHSDRWMCDYCGLRDDVHAIRKHIPSCDKNKHRQQQQQQEEQDDKEQTQLR